MVSTTLWPNASNEGIRSFLVGFFGGSWMLSELSLFSFGGDLLFALEAESRVEGGMEFWR